MKLTPKTVMISTSILLVIMATTSYLYKDHSQVLPAVVKTEKLLISSETSGIVEKYFPSLNSVVKVDEPILKMSNHKLMSDIEHQKRIQERYEQLISSAESGDMLQLEIIEIEENILECNSDICELKLDFKQTIDALSLLRVQNQSSQNKYAVWNKLYTSGEITAEEFERNAQPIVDDILEFKELETDSMRFASNITFLEDEIILLNKNKSLISNNVSLLASKQLIEREEVNTNIIELESNLANLQINSPATGTVTGMFYKPGEKVQSGDVIAEIATLNKIWIIAYGNSASRQNINPGQSVTIMCNNKSKLSGSVVSVSPVMEKVKSLSSNYETINTFSKIEVQFDDEGAARNNLTPGERLFVRINL